MAKKKTNKNTGLLCGVAGFVFGVIALCMGFLAGFSLKEGGDEIATVFQMGFGWKETVSAMGVSATTVFSKFNIWITLGLFMPVIGGLLLLPNNKLLSLISAVLFVVGAVLMFTALSSFQNTLVTDGLGAVTSLVIKEAIKNGTATLGVGAILGGIFSVLGALAAAAKTFFVK